MLLFIDATTLVGALGSLTVIVCIFSHILHFKKNKKEQISSAALKIFITLGFGLWLYYGIKQHNWLLIITSIALIILGITAYITQLTVKRTGRKKAGKNVEKNNKINYNNELMPPDADIQISKISKLYNKISSVVTKATGSPVALVIAVSIIIIWAISGPIFHYSDTWQLVINTGTTVITFLMVFIIQQSQNKDTIAVHLKLNELIAVNEHASNRLVDIEDLSDKELEVLKQFYIKISEMAENDKELFTTHSLDEAAANSSKKSKKVVNS